ncbi:hypothetical protein V6N13_086328 [Hibiscus sabdariffa]
MLSIPTHPVNDFVSLRINLAFDPLTSPHHKIIYVRKQRKPLVSRESVCFIDIYSSETNSWSLSKSKFPCDHGIEFSKAFFFKGAIHWFGELSRSSYFDVENECLKTIPMPRFDHLWQSYFGECGGYLNFTIAHSPPHTYKVFEMAVDGSSWHIKYRLNLMDGLH